MQKQNKDLHLRTFLQKKKKCSIWKWRGKKKDMLKPRCLRAIHLKNFYIKNMDSVGEGEGGKIWENGIETCKYHV